MGVGRYDTTPQAAGYHNGFIVLSIVASDGEFNPKRLILVPSQQVF